MTTSAKSVRGLGAAGAGTQHHIRQRVTALALLFLVPWFIYSIIYACKAGYEGALTWVAQPLNAILLILTLSAALYHMRLGMQVVIEDYIAKSGTRQALLILNTF
ncbi:MAG: succinate dehydrogenase, hydrophobic membrane anchor protein, partial [Pseudomonadota bacterium]